MSPRASLANADATAEEEGDTGAARSARIWAWALDGPVLSALPCPAGATCRELWVLGLDRICSEDLQVQGSHRKGTLPRPTDVPDLRIINS